MAGANCSPLLGAPGAVPPMAVLCCTADPLQAPQKKPRAAGTPAPFGHLGTAEKLGFTHCCGRASWDGVARTCREGDGAADELS